MKDLYIRPDDSSYNVLELSDPISILVIQIEMLLFTKKGDTLGTPDLGIDLDSMVWEVGFNNNQLKQLILTKINTHCPLAQEYGVDVQVYFLRGDDYGQARDFAYIDIFIDGRRVIGTIV